MYLSCDRQSSQRNNFKLNDRLFRHMNLEYRNSVHLKCKIIQISFYLKGKKCMFTLSGVYDCKQYPYQ